MTEVSNLWQHTSGMNNQAQAETENLLKHTENIYRKQDDLPQETVEKIFISFGPGSSDVEINTNTKIKAINSKLMTKAVQH